MWYALNYIAHLVGMTWWVCGLGWHRFCVVCMDSMHPTLILTDLALIFVDVVCT